MTFKQLINKMRIKEAKRLLKKPDLRGTLSTSFISGKQVPVSFECAKGGGRGLAAVDQPPDVGGPVT